MQISSTTIIIDSLSGSLVLAQLHFINDHSYINKILIKTSALVALMSSLTMVKKLFPVRPLLDISW